MPIKPSRPTKRNGDPAVRDTADVEREASASDTAVAPGEERQSERTRQRQSDETDDDIE
jgi:hypothetical protein